MNFQTIYPYNFLESQFNLILYRFLKKNKHVVQRNMHINFDKINSLQTVSTAMISSKTNGALIMKESEEAWSTMLKEVERIETEEGRKVPLTKEDWIEIIPVEIKNFFFEDELRALDISELEQLTKLTPSEVDTILLSIREAEDMNASLGPEEYVAAISAALSERLAAQPIVELNETEEKERLFERLPAFVKDFFSDTWLEKLSSAEIKELLTIPESELKGVIQSLAESSGIKDEPKEDSEPKSKPEIDFRAELIAELKSEIEPAPEIVEDDVSEETAGIEDTPEPRPEVDSENESSSDLSDVLEISYESDDKEKSQDASTPDE